MEICWSRHFIDCFLFNMQHVGTGATLTLQTSLCVVGCARLASSAKRQSSYKTHKALTFKQICENHCTECSYLSAQCRRLSNTRKPLAMSTFKNTNDSTRLDCSVINFIISLQLTFSICWIWLALLCITV